MSEKEDLNVDEGMVTLAMVLLAYMIENDEPLAVRMETVEMLFETVIKSGRIPQFILHESEDGKYLKAGTTLVDENGEVTDYGSE